MRITHATASILIVDDMPQNLHLLRQMLMNNGYQVRPMPNGKLALASAQANPPDLILLDVLMPAMDGFEVCRQLKANPITRDIPIIFVSALSDMFDKVKAFELGAVDYVTKPFQIGEVLARVHTHLTIYHLQQQLHNKVAELTAVGRTIAHDIREPLTALITISEVLKVNIDELDIPTRDKMLNSLYDTSNRLLNILDELLVLSGVHHRAIKAETLNMDTICQKAVQRLATSLENVPVEFTYPQAWELAQGKPEWVEEVWYNYLSNGIKYGGSPPHLELGSDLINDEFVRFWVRDNGQGISKADQSKLFTAHARIGNNTAEGHGLGLSIVERIIEKLGGTVGVNSTVGTGSLFYFTLPKATQPLPKTHPFAP